MALPADHQAILDDMAQLESEFAALLTPLTEAQVHWQAEPGRSWSVGQCVEHLTRTNKTYLPALAAAAEEGRAAGRSRRGPLRPNRLGRWFVAMIEPPARFRVPVPLPEMIPPSHGDPLAIWSGFCATQGEVAALVGTSSDLDLVGLRFRNPLAKNLRMFNLATGFLVIAAHERRHLVQARKVRAHAGFPA
jgi:hypothetical protein